MARAPRSQFPLQAIGIEGALTTLAPAVFLFAGVFSPGDVLSLVRFGGAAAAALLFLLTAVFLLQRPILSKWTGFLAIATTGLTAAPEAIHDPVAALLASITALSFIFLLLESGFRPDPVQPHQRHHPQSAAGSLVGPVGAGADPRVDVRRRLRRGHP